MEDVPDETIPSGPVLALLTFAWEPLAKEWLGENVLYVTISPVKFNPVNDNYTHMLYNNQGLNILRDKIPVKVSSVERWNGQRIQMLLKSASVFMHQLICEILQAA